MTKARNGSDKKRRFGFETIELPRLGFSRPPVDQIAILGAPPDPRSKTAPNLGVGPAQVARRVVLEPVHTGSPYDLSYACLLIPRFGAHRLRGDVVPFLRELMFQVCQSFGWRLDYVMIRPEFLQYVISAPASTPPARSIRTIRDLTSKRIFEDYPHYRDENMGADFWAAPYLVIFGSNPHTPENIVEFIRVTRQGQGFLPDRGR